jgi:hypothetical protein
MELGAGAGFLIGAGVTIFAVSHLVGVGEIADVGFLAYRVYRVSRAAVAFARTTEVADANAAAYMAAIVSGGGTGAALGGGAGLVATAKTCGVGP